MLQTDEKIVEILLKEKNENDNQLLKYFKIGYPNKTIAQESNGIFVGVADYEMGNNGFEFDDGTDLVDILVVTKKRPNKDGKRKDDSIYDESKFIIKTVFKEIRRILRLEENIHILGNKPSFRNITPEYNSNYVINRGHMLLQLKVIDDIDDNINEEVSAVCRILVDDIIIED